MLCHLQIVGGRQSSHEGPVHCLLNLMIHRNGRQFPLRFGNKLHVRMTSVSAKSMRNGKPVHKSDEKEMTRPKRERPEVVSIEDLFRKTKARPEIFYKPLTEEEVKERKGCNV